jgi:agmatine/peptidylarginine deiminase
MPETDLPVPASEAEVTKEWLQAALASSFPEATFVSLDSERIGEAYGFGSLHCLVQLK